MKPRRHSCRRGQGSCLSRDPAHLAGHRTNSRLCDSTTPFGRGRLPPCPRARPWEQAKALQRNCRIERWCPTNAQPHFACDARLQEPFASRVVMPTFATPPDWWISLANLTQWLYWPAWAAIFTLIALWNVTRLADRGRRDERRKDAAKLVGVATLLEAALHPYRVIYKEVQIKLLDQESVTIKMQPFDGIGLIERLDKIDVLEFPTPASISAFVAARIRLLNISLKLGKSVSKSNVSAIKDLICKVESGILRIVKEAETVGRAKISFSTESFLNNSENDGSLEDEFVDQATPTPATTAARSPGPTPHPAPRTP